MPISFAIASDEPSAAPPAPSLESRIATGDPQAIDEVYRAHHAALRGFARRLVGDDDVAEDLVHDTFVALPSAIRRFRGDASLRTFVFAIALRRGHKYIRSAGRRRAALAKLADLPVAASRSPDDDVAHREMAAILYRALDKLPNDQRVAFVLLEIDQLSAAEAAAIVDVPEATMRTRLFHARKKLRTLLEREVP